MHKLIILALLAAVMVSLGGCGSVSESDYQKVISERNTLNRKLISIQAEVDFLKKENDSLRNELKELMQKLILAREAARNVEVKEEESKETPRFYEVKSGDSLWSIAKQFQTSVATLKKLNDLDNSNIRIGQKILLP